KVLPWIKPVMLAASIMLVGLAWYYLNPQDEFTTIRPNPAITQVVEPGTQSALLTLEDGTTINLEEQGEGVLSHNASRTIKKAENGQISYEPGQNLETDEVALNTISVPLGGVFEVILP